MSQLPVPWGGKPEPREPERPEGPDGPVGPSGPEWPSDGYAEDPWDED